MLHVGDPRELLQHLYPVTSTLWSMSFLFLAVPEGKATPMGYCLCCQTAKPAIQHVCDEIRRIVTLLRYIVLTVVEPFHHDLYVDKYILHESSLCQSADLGGHQSQLWGRVWGGEVDANKHKFEVRTRRGEITTKSATCRCWGWTSWLQLPAWTGGYSPI